MKRSLSLSYILALLLNFSSIEPQYSHKLFLLEKTCVIETRYMIFDYILVYEAILITFFQLMSYNSQSNVFWKVTFLKFLKTEPEKNVPFLVSSTNDFDRRFQITYFQISFPRNNKFLHFCNIFQKQSPEGYSVKKAAFKNFAIFIGKHLCLSLYLIKL